MQQPCGAIGASGPRGMGVAHRTTASCTSFWEGAHKSDERAVQHPAIPGLEDECNTHKTFANELLTSSVLWLRGEL